MPEKIPISAVKRFAIDNGLTQVILLAWDKAKTHVVTFGVTDEDCDQAAQGGNKIKKIFGWPGELMQEPHRIVVLRKKIEKLEAEIRNLEEQLISFRTRRSSR